MSKNILIVEDDVQIIKILTDELTKHDMKVSTVDTVRKASESLRNAKPDLILLDIMLPGGLNGFDFLEEVKRQDSTKDIPVIVVTNLDSERNTALKIGAVDYCVKANLSIQDLIKKIQTYLK